MVERDECFFFLYGENVFVRNVYLETGVYEAGGASMHALPSLVLGFSRRF